MIAIYNLIKISYLEQRTGPDATRSPLENPNGLIESISRWKSAQIIQAIPLTNWKEMGGAKNPFR